MHGNYPGHRLSFVDLDGEDLAVGDGGTYKVGVQHAVEGHVAGVAAPAPYQVGVLPTGNGVAK